MYQVEVRPTPSEQDDAKFSTKEPWVRRLWCRANDKEEDIACDICLCDMVNEETGDDLVICDKCQMAVHMSCYGHDLVDGMPTQEEWFCERCSKLIENQEKTGIVP